VGRDEVTSVLLDTHVLLWAITNLSRIGRKARRVLDRATSGDGAFVSAITPWEISMGVERGRISIKKGVEEWVAEALAMPGMRLAPLEPEIAIAAARLPRSFMNDPADQIIVATARHLGVPLLTADHKILDYGRAGHVNAIDATD
jgi:PIN domain nuclease of toxin-antitoxin system